jgi:hypothetical protein
MEDSVEAELSLLEAPTPNTTSEPAGGADASVTEQLDPALTFPGAVIPDACDHGPGGDSPVPESVTICGLPVAESVKVSVADLRPTDVGLNTTPAMHAAAVVPVQLFEASR